MKAALIIIFLNITLGSLGVEFGLYLYNKSFTYQKQLSFASLFIGIGMILFSVIYFLNYFLNLGLGVIPQILYLGITSFVSARYMQKSKDQEFKMTKWEDVEL